MRKFFPKEFILILGLTAITWLLITISTAERSLNVELTVSAPSSIVNNSVLDDTAKVVTMEAKAVGINALRLSSLDDYTVIVDASKFKVADTTIARIKFKDVVSELTKVFDPSISYSAAVSFLEFPCTPLVTKKKPLHFENKDHIKLPKGFQWIEEPHLSQDSIEVSGSAVAVASANLKVIAPDMIWKGGAAESAMIQGLHSQLRANHVNDILIEGNSELWIERRYRESLVISQKIYDIEIWVSGPKDFLKVAELADIGSIETTTHRQSITVQFGSIHPNVSVLSVHPSLIEL